MEKLLITSSKISERDEDTKEEQQLPRSALKKKKPGRPRKTPAPSSDSDMESNPTPSSFDTFMQMVPPPPPSSSSSAPPPPPTPKKASSSKPAPKEDVSRTTRIRKIKMYFLKKKTREMLYDMEAPDEDWYRKASIKEMDDMLTDISMRLNIHFRDSMVQQVFVLALNGIEKGFQMFAKDVEMKGMAEIAKDPELLKEYCGEENYFEPELSELAAEISDDMIPNAKMRMLFKLATFSMMVYEIRKRQMDFEKKEGMHQQPKRREEQEEQDSDEDDSVINLE